jgi:hypothetical protein
MIYTPDSWRIIKIENEDTRHFRILCSWYGGYLGSDSWKISSGIENVIEHETHYEIPQTSGSTYLIYKTNEYMSGMMLGVWESIASGRDGLFEASLMTIDEFLSEWNSKDPLVE